jgi:hypothetical protein
LFGGGANLGRDLQDQVIDDTDEIRKKKMLEAQQRQLMGLAPGGSSSPAGSALGLGSMFGSMTNTVLLR